MPAPIPRTWTTNEIVTATHLNTEIRDTQNYLLRPPGVRAQRTTTQSLTSGTAAAVIFNAADQWDYDAMHDPAVNPSRITINTAGNYLLVSSLEFAAQTTAAGIRQVYWRLNGGTVIGGVETQPMTSAFNSLPVAVSSSAIARLVVGDYVELMALQTSGGSLNINASTDYSARAALQWLST